MTDMTATDLLVELLEYVGVRLRQDLDDLERDEASWRPLPEANSIADIVRHLRLEAEGQVAALSAGAHLRVTLTAAERARIEAVPHDLQANLAALEVLNRRFATTLQALSLEDLERLGPIVYREFPSTGRPPHLLGYHHALHLAMHGGQIRTLRNSYRTTRGEPPRFVPDNPTFVRPAR